jgi:hypothetical protein
MSTNDYPQGNGYCNATVSASNGNVSVVGYLADGVLFISNAPLGQDGNIPVYAYFTGGVGAVCATMPIDLAATTTDIAASGVRWFLATNTHSYYGNGFGTGLTLSAIGTKQPTNVATMITTLGFGTGDSVTLSGGPITTPTNKTIATVVDNAVARICTSSDRKLSITMLKTTGVVSGYYGAPSSSLLHTIRGIILSKGGSADAYGYILTPTGASTGGVGKGGLVDFIR